MANIIKRTWNQNRMVQIEDLKGMTFQTESGGHTFQISGVDDAGNTVALSGSVAGVFLRPDNTDVAISGSASGGVVSVTLPANCYDVPGRFALTIFVTANNQKTAIYAAIGTVSRTSSGTVAPGTTADVTDLINRINAAVATIPASYSSLMADIAPTYSTSALYAVGQYVYYNGDLYRCTTAITTAESWTAAHWTAAVLGNDVSDLKSALSNNSIPLYTEIYVGGNKDITIDPPVGKLVNIHITNLSSEAGYIGGTYKINGNTVISNAPLLNYNESVTLRCAPKATETDTVTVTIVNPNYRRIKIEISFVEYDISTYPIVIVTGSNQNYSTYLPDLDDALGNTVYHIVVTSNESIPDNLPELYNMNYTEYFLETLYTETSKYQKLTEHVSLSDKIRYWDREYKFSQNAWTAWQEHNNNVDFAGAGCIRTYPQLIVTGSGGNYSTYLPDLDDALDNYIYKIVVTSQDNMPENLPSNVGYNYNAYFLETFKANSNTQKNQKITEFNIQNRIHYWERMYRDLAGEWTAWKEIDISKSDTENPLNIIVGPNQQYTSILEGVLAALQVKYSKVLVKYGTYDIAQEILDYYGNDFLSQETVTYRGIPLGNYITVEFETGAKAVLDLTDARYSDSARAMVSIFNSGDSNPEYANTGFTLINAELIGTNCRYCIHDEHGGVLDDYSNHYINCKMHKNRSITMVHSLGRSNNYALGGGLGEHGYITVDGCEFSFTDTAQDQYSATDLWPIFWHTTYYASSHVSCSKIFVRDCIMDTTIRFNCAGGDIQNGVSQMFVTGCKLGSAPQKDGAGADELIAWNNTITGN